MEQLENLHCRRIPSVLNVKVSKMSHVNEIYVTSVKVCTTYNHICVMSQVRMMKFLANCV